MPSLSLQPQDGIDPRDVLRLIIDAVGPHGIRPSEMRLRLRLLDAVSTADGFYQCTPEDAAFFASNAEHVHFTRWSPALVRILDQIAAMAKPEHVGAPAAAAAPMHNGLLQ